MNLAGQTFMYDYDDLQIRSTFLSNDRLRWECLAGPAAGQSGEESFQLATLRPDLAFLAWQEKDKTVIAQVIDLSSMRVHSSITTPDREFYFLQGSVRYVSHE